ncbi:hypothetical protein [Isoptericola sp. BMS4]|uniref:YobI family P-loop NTPase n=1 Tax=Isoptericola sp. BMS4 TaxID=2527875 RepID=UPI00142376B4|nr:hypothetical protein [Isoptericola sp. BMS4]
MTKQSDEEPDEGAETGVKDSDASKKIELRTLAPDFKGDHHDLYVRHLEEAVQEKRNRNIALTGRYGVGKSSVLDQFEENHKSKTVRISISTLGPDDDDEDLTNRIQKELVKQLVYRLKPGRLRGSRVARRNPLTKWRALWQALGVSSATLVLLWLLGVQPPADWPGAQASVPTQVGLILVFFVLMVGVVWSLRWLVGDRIVSEVATAGTKIALDESPSTYFDSFLDEIVAFFDKANPEFVIFEDLDRFDDPQIFDSLRELNTLVNASAQWANKDRPLRFIYAIKDSLFEQLGAKEAPKVDGTPTGEADDEKRADATARAVESKPDLAAEAVRRANRTKFFELVIPIVPFLSHRNARDHLAEALKELGFPDDFVSRPLVDLVAKHTTDMRLMINICNEFAVFVERLLWTKTPAPAMTADHLFALVVYKNFHMADFEKIAQRTSTLDELERLHRDEVRALIEYLQSRRRARNRVEETRNLRHKTAAVLGERLKDMKNMFVSVYNDNQVVILVGDQTFTLGETKDVEFWALVAETCAFSLRYPNNQRTSVDAARIDRLFPELRHAEHWVDPTPEEFAGVMAQYDDDVSMLRGADFADLARYERVPSDRIPFDQLIEGNICSELARDLVRKGFITRNFAEYSAIFYGKFTGVDVAHFYNHSVQPSEMYLDYHFTSKNALNNLMAQVPDDFTNTVSALNIEVADFLLRERRADAERLIAFIVAHQKSDQVREFLSAFLNTPGVAAERLVEMLARHPWANVFEYLAAHTELPDEETRIGLFDAALLGAQHADSYDFGEHASELIRSSHAHLTAVKRPQADDTTERLFEVLKVVDLVVPNLAALSEPLRDRIVGARMYDISVSNLKLALGIDEVPTLDEVRKNPKVWEHCKARIADYLVAMQADDASSCLVQSEQVLVDVLNEQGEAWTEEQLHSVIDGGAETLKVSSLNDVPKTMWPFLVDANHVRCSTANVASYEAVHDIDQPLSSFLTSADDSGPVELLEVEEVGDDERAKLAIKVLNASAHLPARTRVALASQVVPEEGFDLTPVEPSKDQLLAHGLEAGLFDDDFETFAHFAPGGWNAMSEAFKVSKGVDRFIEPEIVEGFVAEFLEGDSIDDGLKKTVVGKLSEYVPDDDEHSLRAACCFANKNRIKLPSDEIRRIARVTKSAESVMRQLVLAKGLSDDDVVSILASLGEPYNQLTAGPDATFDYAAAVNSASSAETVFKHLEKAERIEIVKNGVKRRKTVRVLV